MNNFLDFVLNNPCLPNEHEVSTLCSQGKDAGASDAVKSRFKVLAELYQRRLTQLDRLSDQLDRYVPWFLVVLMTMFWYLLDKSMPFVIWAQDPCWFWFQILSMHANVEDFKTTLLNDLVAISTTTALIATCGVGMLLFDPRDYDVERKVWLEKGAHTLFVVCCVLCGVVGVVSIAIGIRRYLMINLLGALDVVLYMETLSKVKTLEAFKLAQISFGIFCGAIWTVVWLKNGAMYGAAVLLFLTVTLRVLTAELGVLDSAFHSTRYGSFQKTNVTTTCEAMIEFAGWGSGSSI